MFKCVLDIKLWMTDFLQQNQDKTKVLVTDTEAQRDKLNTKLQALALNPCQQEKTQLSLIQILVLNLTIET